MAVDVIMPQMGESIFEGTITKWLKKPGDRVERDEPLFEISTDKVDAEIPSPAAGVLSEIKVAEGQTVPIQTVVAVLDGASATQATAAVSPPTAPAASSVTPTAAKGPDEPGRRPADDSDIHSSPLVQRLARENNIDLATVRGTGAGGRISKQDIQAVIAARGSGHTAAPAPQTHAAAASPVHGAFEAAVPRERIYFGRYEVRPLSVMRQKIAEHMVASKRVAPHVYSIEEADLTPIAQLRAAKKDEFELRHRTKLTFLPFFVRACANALRQFPIVNASLDGTNVVLHSEVNIGVAVALEWGLIVPVLKNADKQNFLELQRAVNDLADRARAKKLKPEEVQESTFSITNPGSIGGLMGLPIINQPNVAILGIGAIQKRPVVVDDAVAIRSMVYITLSYDHRVVDGAVGHQFMAHVKRSLETCNESIL